MTPDRKKPGVAFWATVVVVGALMPISVYVGMYAWMVSPSPTVLEDYGKPVEICPDYSDSPRDQEFWEKVFGPVHWIDRKIRRETWSVH